MREARDFALGGLFLDTPDPQTLRVRQGWAEVRNGTLAGIAAEKPADLPGKAHPGCLIIPGMTDLHLHAAQYAYHGMAMDVSLLDWLERYAFAEEGRFADTAYAERVYRQFVTELLGTATTRCCVFASIHREATLLLMRLLKRAGLGARVGKLNMDRNAPDCCREASAEASLAETRRWITEWAAENGEDELVRPILTPRFTPSVSDACMAGLGRLAAEFRLPAQSHLSENRDEIAWVRELCPDTRFYAESYSRWGLFGGGTPTVMAHCIYSGGEETALLKERGVWIAHCPTSNGNVIAGIAPAARYLRGGWRIGLGSDIAGGHTLNLFAVMQEAVRQSKIRWLWQDPDNAPLSLTEAFWMATAGGGSFFGSVGLFEPGYAFDAAVIDDGGLATPRPASPAERLERWTYRGNGRVREKYVAGRRVFPPENEVESGIEPREGALPS